MSATQTLNSYDIGDEIELRAECTNADGDLVNPSGGVQMWYRKPRSQTRVAVTLANPEVGVFVGSVIPAAGEHGDWWYRSESAGSVVQAAERSFNVRKSKVPA